MAFHSRSLTDRKVTFKKSVKCSSRCLVGNNRDFLLAPLLVLHSYASLDSRYVRGAIEENQINISKQQTKQTPRYHMAGPTCMYIRCITLSSLAETDPVICESVRISPTFTRV